MNRTGVFLYLFLALSAVPLHAADVYTVSHVSDGDTLVLSDGQKVRLIGVDTPEMEDPARNGRNASYNHLKAQIVNDFAVKAKECVRAKVEGRPVRLELRLGAPRQVRPHARLRVSRTGRDLFERRDHQAGVWVRLSALLVQIFRAVQAYQREAREAKSGLWK